MSCARAAYAEMRSFARLSASHSGSLGGSPNRDGASVAPGSRSNPVPPTSTYVAIERTPSESAASGMTFIGWASDAASAVDFDTRAGDHRRVVRGEEHRGPREILRLVQAPERNRRHVPRAGGVVHFGTVHERRQHRRL